VKKILLSFIILAAMMASCQRDCDNSQSEDSKVDITIEVTSPAIGSMRSEASNLDSALGAIDNFNNNSEWWEEYDLRYSLEIYEILQNGSDSTISDNPIYQRQVKTVDRYSDQSINFKMQVVPNRTYLFVVWADFVDEGTNSDLFYNTSNLRSISRTESYTHTAMEEALDAYHICSTETIKKSATLNLTLTRPMGKLRVVAIDYDEVSNYSTPTNVSVKFDTENNPVYKSFNAVTNEIGNSCPLHEYSYSIDPMPYKNYVGKNSEGDSVEGIILFSDYIFTPRNTSATEKNEYPVSFSMTIVYDNNAEINRVIDFDTQIPLCRNYLTTIVGNCLTQKEGFVIEIDDTLQIGEEITK
jgi:hypothetical protein